MQIVPTPLLARIVRHYLLLETQYVLPLHFRLFSDGSPGMVFYLDAPLRQMETANETIGETVTHPRSLLYGQINRYQNLVSTGKLRMLVVVLQPDAVFKLTGNAAFELNDAVVALDLLFGRAATVLEEAVLEAADNAQRIRLIEAFLMKKCAQTKAADPIVTQALALIDGSKGSATVATMLKTLPVTERQLERKFKQHTGVGPKRFANVVRLQYFLKSLHHAPAGTRTVSVAYDGGFYDQAHMNHELKKYAGITPSEYRAHRHLLASNFLQTV